MSGIISLKPILLYCGVMKADNSREGMNVGDAVWYVAGDRERAEIVKLSGATHVVVRLLTGPCKGQEIEAPWGIIQPIAKDQKNV